LRIDFPGLRNGMGGGGGRGGRELDPSPRDVGVDGPASAELVAIAVQIGRRPNSKQTPNHLAPGLVVSYIKNGHLGNSSNCLFNS
jgi:hypothetical protein